MECPLYLNHDLKCFEFVSITAPGLEKIMKQRNNVKILINDLDQIYTANSSTCTQKVVIDRMANV